MTNDNLIVIDKTKDWKKQLIEEFEPLINDGAKIIVEYKVSYRGHL